MSNAVLPDAVPANASVPSRHRLALLIVIGVYPLITAIIYVVSSFTAGWEIWQRNFIVAPVMVAAMVYVMIPAIQKRFRRFLGGAPRHL
jgi:antibiotic biosynthesis monooxygenase (ABM) superfamily enzyme